MADDSNKMENSTIDIANEIWSSLADANNSEPQLTMKPFYDEVLRNEDKSDFKEPWQLAVDEYKAVILKTQWNPYAKYSCFSFYMATVEKSIHPHQL